MWKIRSHTKNKVTTPQKFISFFLFILFVCTSQYEQYVYVHFYGYYLLVLFFGDFCKFQPFHFQ